MHLIHCARPTGDLEPAPRSSWSEGADGEAWEGFWSVGDERYYARRTGTNGREQWFRFAEESVAIPTSCEPRVLPLRRKGHAIGSLRRTVIVGTRGTRLMLVGRSRRERRGGRRGGTR